MTVFRSPIAGERRLVTRLRGAAAMLLVSAALTACTGEQFQKGYILPPGALEQIPIGASQDQVLIVMGTPSTVATLSGEVFYYISQRSERKVAFMQQTADDARLSQAPPPLRPPLQRPGICPVLPDSAVGS